MQKTSNYGLNKPDGTDTVDISLLNQNMDTIDVKLKSNADNAEALEGKVSSHLADNTKHITSVERTTWSAKQDSLEVENRRKITFGTANPTGGADGDIYLQYT